MRVSVRKCASVSYSLKSDGWIHSFEERRRRGESVIQLVSQEMVMKSVVGTALFPNKLAAVPSAVWFIWEL